MAKRYNPNGNRRRNCQKFRIERIKPAKIAKNDSTKTILIICGVFLAVLIVFVLLMQNSGDDAEKVREVIESDELQEQLNDIVDEEYKKLQDFMNSERQNGN